MFDYQTALYLGWMSSNIHLRTLSVFRNYFRSRPQYLLLRLVGLTVSLVLLCVAIFPTIHSDWAGTLLSADNLNSPDFSLALVTTTGQFINNQRLSDHESRGPHGFLSYSMIIISHLWQVCLLSSRIHGASRRLTDLPLRCLRNAVERRQSYRVKKTWIYKTFTHCLEGLLTALFAIVELSSSHAMVLLIITTTLIWNSFQLFIPRFHNIPPCVKKELHSWNFGQLLPMLLTYSPLFSISTHLLDTKVPPIETGSTAKEMAKDSESTPETSLTNLRFMYSSIPFRAAILMFCSWAVLSIAALFVWTGLAFLRPRYFSGPTPWYFAGWNLALGATVVGASFIAILVLCMLIPCFVRTQLPDSAKSYRYQPEEMERE